MKGDQFIKALCENKIATYSTKMDSHSTKLTNQNTLDNLNSDQLLIYMYCQTIIYLELDIF